MKSNYTKSFVLFTALFSLFILSEKIEAQNSTHKEYVSLIIDGVNSSQEANSIDVLIKTKPGMITSRMDQHRKMYFGIFDNSHGITLKDFENWISGLGYHVKCSHKGSLGEGRVVLLNESDCGIK